MQKFKVTWFNGRNQTSLIVEGYSLEGMTQAQKDNERVFRFANPAMTLISVEVAE